MKNKIEIKTGDCFVTNEGCNLTVVKYYTCENVIVRFDDGNEIRVQKGHLLTGKVRNLNHKSVYSVGFLGYGKFNKREHENIYDVWSNMLGRCYDSKMQNLPQNTTYINCSVDVRWYSFQIFCEWYVENFIKGFQIDKDLLHKGNKIYSPENCVFIHGDINNALQTRHSKNSNFPTGVSKNGKKFNSFCRIGDDRIRKSFDTPEEAHEFYRETKQNYVRSLAEKHKLTLTDQSYIALKNWTL